MHFHRQHACRVRETILEVREPLQKTPPGPNEKAGGVRSYAPRQKKLIAHFTTKIKNL